MSLHKLSKQKTKQQLIISTSGNPDQVILQLKHQLIKQAIYHISVLFIVVPGIFYGFHQLIT